MPFFLFWCCSCVWFQAVWDSSLGFSGEGPVMSTFSPTLPRCNATPVGLAVTEDTHAEHLFMSNACSVLAGDTQAKGPASKLQPGISNEQIEEVLVHLATRGNSARPVAARLQQFPSNVTSLVGDPTSLTAESARRGVAHRFHERPVQWHRPRRLRAALDQELAASTEIARLFNECNAIERCPEHDGRSSTRERDFLEGSGPRNYRYHF